MAKAKSLENLGKYTYTVQEDGPRLKKGDKIEIRRMSEKERRRFIDDDLFIYQAMLEKMQDKFTEGEFSPADFNRIHETAMKLGKQLCMQADRVKVEGLRGTPNNVTDLMPFIYRIIQVEVTLESGEGVPDQFSMPDPDDVDDMSDEEVDKAEEAAKELGEDSAPSESHTTTVPSGSPAETSSNSPEEDSAATE